MNLILVGTSANLEAVKSALGTVSRSKSLVHLDEPIVDRPTVAVADQFALDVSLAHRVE